MVAAAGRNRKNAVQSKIMNALDWEPASEILHCCNGFQPVYSTAAAFLFVCFLFSGRRCITAKLSKLLKLKWQQKSWIGNRKLNNFYNSSTCWCTKSIWDADFRLLPWWNPSAMWVSASLFFIVVVVVVEEVSKCCCDILNTQFFHEERAKEAMFCWGLDVLSVVPKQVLGR